LCHSSGYSERLAPITEHTKSRNHSRFNSMILLVQRLVPGRLLENSINDGKVQ